MQRKAPKFVSPRKTRAAPARIVQAQAPKPPAATPASGRLLVLEQVRVNIVGCESCQRLRQYCTALGETRRKAYRDQQYS
jgi:hypothetical protein